MRIFVFIVALLLIAAPAQAQWVDNGDGTSTRSITMSTSLTASADPVLEIVELDGVEDWVDIGDGSWKVAAVQSSPTTEAKNILEQCRARDNYNFRYAEDQLDASEWLGSLLIGIDITRTEEADDKAYSWSQVLWRAFCRDLRNNHASWVSSPSSDWHQNGLNATVPAPPNQP